MGGTQGLVSLRVPGGPGGGPLRAQRGSVALKLSPMEASAWGRARALCPGSPADFPGPLALDNPMSDGVGGGARRVVAGSAPCRHRAVPGLGVLGPGWGQQMGLAGLVPRCLSDLLRDSCLRFPEPCDEPPSPARTSAQVKLKEAALAWVPGPAVF